MELKSVVPWGRSLAEYCAMFSLTDADLAKNMLGCGDGPASFNAEVTGQGGHIVSVDPTYCFSAQALKSRIDEVYDEIMPQMRINQDQYIWDSIPSVEALGRIRMASMAKFISDYTQGKAEGRYVQGSLPSLEFSDQQFELALCSHFLFLYSDHVDCDTHIAALKELCRVAKEVRVYPLLSLSGDLSPHLSATMDALDQSGYEASLVDVAYQFQKGATQMLRVRPK